MAPEATETLGRERYANLVTLKRDGSEVRTPIWIARVDEKLYAFTDGTTVKVKRLRRNARIRLAACDARGKISGGWHAASGKVVDDPGLITKATDALARKYGWQFAALNLASRLFGRIGRRVILEFSIDS
jgi:PPOX class probable F420-dependent enzyme